MKTNLLLFLLAVLVAALCSGCTTIHYRAPGGTEVSATSFLNKRSIAKASFDPATGKLVVEGYSSEQTELAAAVAQAVASALVPKTP